MAAYFDTSVLLSALLGDVHAARALEQWREETDRVSSILLEVECRTVLRRIPSAAITDAARREAERRLETALEEVTLKPLDEDILAIVRSTPGLGGCRTLDAVHLATALYFHAAADDGFHIDTFDAQMGEVARRLGLVVRGE
jgi:predicted nucleic acid-binding protein